MYLEVISVNFIGAIQWSSMGQPPNIFFNLFSKIDHAVTVVLCA